MWGIRLSNSYMKARYILQRQHRSWEEGRYLKDLIPNSTLRAHPKHRQRWPRKLPQAISTTPRPKGRRQMQNPIHLGGDSKKEVWWTEIPGQVHSNQALEQVIKTLSSIPGLRMPWPTPGVLTINLRIIITHNNQVQMPINSPHSTLEVRMQHQSQNWQTRRNLRTRRKMQQGWPWQIIRRTVRETLLHHKSSIRLSEIQLVHPMVAFIKDQEEGWIITRPPPPPEGRNRRDLPPSQTRHPMLICWIIQDPTLLLPNGMGLRVGILSWQGRRFKHRRKVRYRGEMVLKVDLVRCKEMDLQHRQVLNFTHPKQQVLNSPTYWKTLERTRMDNNSNSKTTCRKWGATHNKSTNQLSHRLLQVMPQGSMD